MISAFYQHKLSSLKVDRSSGHPKPHKICLLLAVMDLIKNGQVVGNRFEINDDLKTAFSFYFDQLKKANDADKIIQPFYHLHTDKFWHFKIKPGKQVSFNKLKSQRGTPSKKALFDVIDYAYLDDDVYEYFRNELTREQAKESLLENLGDLSVQFHRWLLSMGKSEKTAMSYVGAIKGSISTWASDANITQQNLIAIQSYSTINRISAELAGYQMFQDRNMKGKNMYSCALNSYKDFLSITCQAQVSQDIENIIKDESVETTQKAVLVNTRVGQGKFRESLIKYWKGCAVTGYQLTQFLVASHIKLWRDANNDERLDKYNGILLLPNLDKAFDLGYICFTDKGKIRISEFIESPKMLGINKSMQINVIGLHQEYLAYHRECVYERRHNNDSV
ncbi:putative type II restriction endonuclease [hydrothermal vent metagenome]|uniref:Putative type II restriction endonuclease n=1 Tax=hydrothermal vent metagenome TaxID=652676 RepID=A0A3B1A0F6_9ZZZZ